MVFWSELWCKSTSICFTAVHEREYFHCTEPSEYEKYIRALYNKEIDEEKLEENSRQFMKKNFDIKKSLNDYKEMLLLSED